MNTLKVHINLPKFALPAYRAFFEEFAWNKGIDLVFAEAENALIIGANPKADFEISKAFLNQLDRLSFHWKDVFGKESPWVKTEKGKPDLVSTALYMLFSGQEYGRFTADAYGRFPYAKSYQAHFDLVEVNRVQEIFDALADHEKVKPFVKVRERENAFFLSHDNDQFHQSWKEDGFWALKKGEIGGLLKILSKHVQGKPLWRNMVEIMDLEHQFGRKSTFFWLVENKNTPEGFTNADYEFSSKAVTKLYQEIKERGWRNGLHKSLLPKSFSEEMSKFPNPPTTNRNHFLSLQVPETFLEMEAAGIRLDSSLGFAETHGFRNNYGLPYRVFDFKGNRSLRLIEAPLHIMDASQRTYQKRSPEQAQKCLVEFLDKNPKNLNCGLLWHNKFFSDYKFRGWKEVYKSLLKKGEHWGHFDPDAFLSSRLSE